MIRTGNPARFGNQGRVIYDALKDNPNLFLMLGGHICSEAEGGGEGRRQDTFRGQTVHTLLSNYQCRANGGDGWLRILQFSPQDNEIQITTFSPTLDRFETDDNSHFTLPYDMSDANPFRLVHVAATGHLTLDGITLTGGRAQFDGSDPRSSNGGGLLNFGVTTLNNSQVIGNVGGGVYNDGGMLTVSNTLIAANSRPLGGGIFNREPGKITIEKSTITENTGQQGGGVNNFDNSTMTITNSAIFGNMAGLGGGMANEGDANLTIINSTITENQSTPMAGAGGGIDNDDEAILTILNSTIVNNTIPNIRIRSGPFELQNTILDDCLFDRDVPISLGHNLIIDPDPCNIALLPSDQTGEANLGPFTDNGTPGNGHLSPLSESPAIDAANDAACPATDQLGLPRFGACDIGAIEAQSQVFDTDGDGIVDATETLLGTVLTNPDTDRDGIFDGDEFLSGTDPLEEDSNDNGIPDGQDVKTQHFDLVSANSEFTSFQLGLVESAQGGTPFVGGRFPGDGEAPVLVTQSFVDSYVPDLQNIMLSAFENLIQREALEDRFIFGVFIAWSFPSNFSVTLLFDDLEVLTFDDFNIDLLQPQPEELLSVLRVDLGILFREDDQITPQNSYT